MKKLTYILTAFFLTTSLLIVGCGDDDTDLTLEQQQLQAIAGEWATSSTSDVKLGNDDAPGDWSNFSITFRQGGGVSIEGAPADINIFNISSFTVSGENTSLLSLVFNGDPTETATAEINNSQMTLTFTLASDEDQLGARQNSVNGSWTFFLTVQ